MSELPFLGLRQGMFSGAASCRGCGFATTDPNVYECPNCGTVWKERPKASSVGLNCVACGQRIEPGEPVSLTEDGLGHQKCPVKGPEVDADGLSEAPEGYLSIVASAPAEEATPRPKKKRKRKRKKKPASRPSENVQQPPA